MTYRRTNIFYITNFFCYCKTLQLFMLSFGLFFFLASELPASVPAYIENWNQPPPQELIRDDYGQGNYLDLHYQKFIDKSKVNFILEIGSRDAIDALDLSHFYKAHVCAFECNPEALNICYHNRNNNPNVTIVPLAAWKETQSLRFYPIVRSNRNFNLGASSLFRMDSNSPDLHPQEEIEVNATRLDEWLDSYQYDTPDLICIDAQGATLGILEGLGDKLAQVKYIIAEVEFVRFYEGEALHPEIAAFMEKKGFEETVVLSNGLFADILYVRKI